MNLSYRQGHRRSPESREGREYGPRFRNQAEIFKGAASTCRGLAEPGHLGASHHHRCKNLEMMWYMSLDDPSGRRTGNQAENDREGQTMPFQPGRIVKALARLAPTVAVSLLLAGQAPALLAQNILTNPDFDSGLNGWQPLPMVFWDGSVDADGSPTSGSAKASFSSGFPTAGDYPVISQCVPLTSGDSYALGGKVLIDDGSFDTYAHYTVTLFPATGCTGAPLPSPPIATPAVTTVNSWVASTASFTNGLARSALFSAAIFLMPGSSFKGNFDDTFVIANGCVPDAQTLCLQSLRFKVVATFDAGTAGSGTANVGTLTSNTGYLWFFSASNVEAVIKVLDGCGLNGRYWFFAAGLTNVEVTISVTDTVSGVTRTYTNPASTAFQPVQDTSAFACP
jgi:hypothetical protein